MSAMAVASLRVLVDLDPCGAGDDDPVKLIGSGKPGALWRRAYDELQRYKLELAGTPW